MTAIYNDPASFKDDMIDGFVAAYSRYVERVPGACGVMRAGGPREGKVSVIAGGGSGHYPAFCGLVGQGLADGAVIGDIFTSPSNEQAYRVGRALDGGAGVLFSFGNYAGDVMNFGAAPERLRAEGIDCRTVLVTDDVASAPPAEKQRRRGIAGDLVVFKLAGAAADRGDSIDESSGSRSRPTRRPTRSASPSAAARCPANAHRCSRSRRARSTSGSASTANRASAWHRAWVPASSPPNSCDRSCTSTPTTRPVARPCS